MHQSIHVSAPGKIILLGEHSVVYGKPAIIASIAKRCHITISPREDNNIEIVAKNLDAAIIRSGKEIVDQTKHAQQQWENFAKANDVSILKAITSQPFDYPIIIIGETLGFYKASLPHGFTLTIDSVIPIGCGVGSSASLAVSIATALSLFLEKAFDEEIINTIAFLAEQKKHGFPSGGDNSTCNYGGLVWFRKETPEFKIIQQIPFALPDAVAKNFGTVFTGIPNESTGEMVSHVKSQFTKAPKKIQKIFDEQEQLTRDLLTALKNANHQEIIHIIRAGEKNLEKLGVVSSSVISIIRKIEKAGGAAKICGGGGKTKGTGTVLIYHTNKKMLKDVLQKEQQEFCDIILGDEGVKIEK